MKKEDINTIEEEDSKNEQTSVSSENEKETENITNADESCDNDKCDETEKCDSSDSVETPESLLEKAQAKIADLEKQALYRQAEFDNFRKRTLKEKADLILAGGEKTITAILPVLDDFERALQDNSTDPEAIREGVKLIFTKFTKTLEQLGVKKIETEGAEFNVDYHESIALVPGLGADKKGKVIDCVQTGYTLNDKVIRYAKVAVGE